MNAQLMNRQRLRNCISKFQLSRAAAADIAAASVRLAHLLLHHKVTAKLVSSIWLPRKETSDTEFHILSQGQSENPPVDGVLCDCVTLHSVSGWLETRSCISTVTDSPHFHFRLVWKVFLIFHIIFNYANNVSFTCTYSSSVMWGFIFLYFPLWDKSIVFKAPLQRACS